MDERKVSLRIREDGRVLCAAIHPPKKGDTYLHDGISYILTVELEVLVTDEDHSRHGKWWWKHQREHPING